MTSIKLLPKDLANVIAAGEVIERPASLAKELIENSIDAKSTRIEIHCQNGGFTAIRVTDNGQGIFEEELELAVSDRATSKVYQLADLLKIQTLGFRGEALASMAAVSRLQIASKPALQTSAWQLQVSEKNHFKKNPVSHPDGTTIVVTDLFYNVPVRKKFLHSVRSEQLQVDKIVKSLALSHFHIHFIYYVDDKLIWNCPPASTPLLQLQRVSKLLGKRYLDAGKIVECQHQHFDLRGWLMDVTHHSSQNDGQLFYVNNRVVKDKLLYHAVKAAYSHYLPEGRYPFYCLYLTCDPAVVDVNVHPTKHEVRFLEARWVHDFIKSSVIRALENNESGAQIQPFSENVKSQISLEIKSPLERREKNFSTTADFSLAPDPLSPVPGMKNLFHSFAEAKLAENRALTPANLLWVLLLKERYILAKKQEDFFIIDGVAAYQTQKLADLESLLNSEKALKTVNLLLPYTCSLEASLIENLLSAQTLFQNVGIEFSRLSPETLVVRTIPQACEKLNIKNFMAAMSLFLKNKKLENISSLLKELVNHEVISLAQFSERQQQELLIYVEENSNPRYCRVWNVEEFFNDNPK